MDPDPDHARPDVLREFYVAHGQFVLLFEHQRAHHCHFENLPSGTGDWRPTGP
jgi:hypothetical protein